MKGQQGFAAPQIDAIALKGGLDEITPSLLLPSGALRQSYNFEAALSGGYSRIKGYERVDGHRSPSEAAEEGLHRYISVGAYTTVPVVGDTLVASGGATGVVAYIDGATIVLTKVTGTLAVAETLTVLGVGVGTIDSVSAGPVDAEQDALARNAVASIYRADILAVPGSGPIRGVVEFNDVVYAFRNNLGATASALYKTTASGWELVPFYNTVSFTAGGVVAPADGATLTQGGVTAVIKRVVRTSGSWAGGTAAGQFIVATPAGGNFSAAAATIGAVNVTLSGIQTAITMLPGGRFVFDEHNFAGQAVTKRVYGCDGVNRGFEFDGDVLVPITTGATPDTPTCVRAHAGALFFAVRSSALFSAPGLPFDWSAISGAGEIALGSVITDMVLMPGTVPTLGIGSRDNIFILYGTGSADFNLTSFNNGSGVCSYSMQNMAQTYLFDDRGVIGLKTAQEYGNFAASALTNTVTRFINEHINLLTGSTLCRRKNQYRLFFSDGAGLYITVVNNKLLGCMPVKFNDVVRCTYEGKKSDGTDIMYFGSDDGLVYQMEKGTSFDGDAIEFSFATNFSNAKSPRTLKRYRKASIEITSEDGCFASFDFSYVLGYDSAEYNQASSQHYEQYTGQTRWDSFVWDNFFWDANRIQPMECSLDGTAENISLIVSGSSAAIPPFTINSFLVHFSPRRMMR
jgi:hypothetical protein